MAMASALISTLPPSTLPPPLPSVARMTEEQVKRQQLHELALSHPLQHDEWIVNGMAMLGYGAHETLKKTEENCIKLLQMRGISAPPTESKHRVVGSASSSSLSSSSQSAVPSSVLLHSSHASSSQGPPLMRITADTLAHAQQYRPLVIQSTNPSATTAAAAGSIDPHGDAWLHSIDKHLGDFHQLCQKHYHMNTYLSTTYSDVPTQQSIVRDLTLVLADMRYMKERILRLIYQYTMFTKEESDMYRLHHPTMGAHTQQHWDIVHSYRLDKLLKLNEFQDRLKSLTFC